MALGTTKATVALTTTEIVPENPGRGSLTIVNDSDEDIYLSEVPIGGAAAAVMNEGILIKAAGGVWSVARGKVNARLFGGAVNAICLSGGKNVTISELDQR